MRFCRTPLLLVTKRVTKRAYNVDMIADQRGSMKIRGWKDLLRIYSNFNVVTVEFSDTFVDAELGVIQSRTA